jgi:metal-responsive CopG/Arc/MetJ family transcriptional regulator
MKTAVSIPDEVFHRADEAAAMLRFSRSQLYTEALRLFLQTHGASTVTERLNAIYEREASELDPAFDALQSEVLLAESEPLH